MKKKTAKIIKLERSRLSPFFSIMETKGSNIRDKRMEITKTINISERRKHKYKNMNTATALKVNLEILFNTISFIL
jgi:hypothetical protein